MEQDLLKKGEGERLGVTVNTASTDIFYLDAKGDMDAAHFVAERRRGWKLGEVRIDGTLRAQSAINVQAQRMRPSKGRMVKSATRRVEQKKALEREESRNPTVYDMWIKEVSAEEKVSTSSSLLMHSQFGASLFSCTVHPCPLGLK